MGIRRKGGKARSRERERDGGEEGGKYERRRRECQQGGTCTCRCERKCHPVGEEGRVSKRQEGGWEGGREREKLSTHNLDVENTSPGGGLHGYDQGLIPHMD